MRGSQALVLSVTVLVILASGCLDSNSKRQSTQPTKTTQVPAATNEQRNTQVNVPTIQGETAVSWYNKSSALINLGKNDDAIQAIDKAIELDPNFAYAWNNKGWALNNLGRYDEALQACDKAIQLGPNLAYAWNNKGWALQKLGHSSEAEAAFAKAKELGYTG